MKRCFWLILPAWFSLNLVCAQLPQLAVLKYQGGGDWYANPSSVPNLVKYCRDALGMALNPEVAVVEPGSSDLFRYPWVHATGHGNIVLSTEEARNLRLWMMGGGFLHIDDNYGMDEYARREIKKMFPDHNLESIPSNHPIFRKPFTFAQGMPKIHEHDLKAPQALGIFIEGRLVLLYTVETDLGDGWEDPEVHGDSESTRKKALQMGANMLYYVFLGASMPN